MIGEANLDGLYLPWLLLLAGLALLAQWAARRVLASLGVYRWVWHPALFDAALYVLLLFAFGRGALFLQSTT
jgi:hypothetical protein